MPDLRSFLEELQHRKVVRTALVYAVVAWMVIEVASVILPALLLPSWTLTLVVVLALLGFPLVLALEWVFEVTGGGVRREAGDAASGAGSGVLRPAGVGALGLLAVGLGAWYLWPDAGGTPGDDAPLTRAAVAVLPFDIRGSADIAYLREGMVDLLSTKLDGTESLRPLDPRTVLTFLAREGVDAGDPAVARTVSRRFGAGHYVQGSIVEFGGRLQVRASLYRLDDGDEPVVEAAVEGDADQLFRLVDDLAVEILTGSRGGSVSRLTRLAALTTDSLPALKAYLEGESAYRAGQWSEAVGSYGRAVEIDSTFALAHYRLASAAVWAERHEIVGAALDAARRHGERLSSHDRDLVEAQAAYRSGEHARAERLYRDITAAHPDDVEAWYQLGEILLHEGYLRGTDLGQARHAFERAVGLDPELYPALWHLASLLALEGRNEEFDSVTARVLRLNPGDGFTRLQHVLYRGGPAAHDSVIGAIRRGETALDPQLLLFSAAWAPDAILAERLAGAVTSEAYPPRWVVLAHLARAAGRLNQGRWTDAEATLAEAGAIDPALALEHRALLALVAHPNLAGDEELEEVRADLLAWDGSGTEPAGATPEFDSPHAGLHGYLRPYLLGLVEARLGNAPGALARARALEAATPTDDLADFVAGLAATVRAEAARAEGDPQRALDVLQEAPLWTVHRLDERLSVFVSQSYPVFLRGELLRELGRGREALRWYSDWGPGDPFHTAVLLRRATIHDALGEAERARALREDVRAVWRDADVPLDTVVARLR